MKFSGLVSIYLFIFFGKILKPVLGRAGPNRTTQCTDAPSNANPVLLSDALLGPLEML
jgi:hypothetical protein